MAEGWLTQGVSKEPRPAELHSEYIAFSRAAVSRIQRLIYSGIAVAFVLVLGLAVFSFYQRQQAVKIARIAIAQSLAATAAMNLETDPELSLLLATKSVRIMSEANETVLPLSNTVLHQSTIKSRIRLALTGHDGGVESAAYSPDGRRIVTAGQDRTAKVWEAQTGKELLTLTGHNGPVTSAAYSPDGQWIVTASIDAKAKVWEAQTGQELITLTGRNGWVYSAAYSEDGQRIVTASYDKTAKVWDTKTGQELAPLIGHGGLVTAGWDGTAKVWDIETGQELDSARMR